jgi:hypothetical protein
MEEGEENERKKKKKKKSLWGRRVSLGLSLSCWRPLLAMQWVTATRLTH